MKKILISAVALALGVSMASAERAGNRSSGHKFPAAPKCTQCAATYSPRNTKAAIARAKQAILYRLKDPDSARWRLGEFSPAGNVCIEVNAKNSYGGYAGFELYSYEARTGDLLGGEGGYSWMFCRTAPFMPAGSIVIDAR